MKSMVLRLFRKKPKPDAPPHPNAVPAAPPAPVTFDEPLQEPAATSTSHRVPAKGGKATAAKGAKPAKGAKSAKSAKPKKAATKKAATKKAAKKGASKAAKGPSKGKTGKK